MNKKVVHERAALLVGTSVDDLQSGLWFFQWNKKLHVEIVREGLSICEKRGEKPKATILRRKLIQMEKNIKALEEMNHASL